MEQLTRHLVSQHFGRVVAQVDWDERRHGIIQLSLERPHHLATEFTFSGEVLQRIFDHAVSWKEMAVRLAVSQAHKLYLKHRASIMRQAAPLSLEVSPWVGDLLTAPYGGATLGLESTAAQPPIAGDGGILAAPGFGDRLRAALRAAGWHSAPRALAREFNKRTTGAHLTVRAARQWLHGSAVPTPDELKVLAEWLGVAGAWLQFGEGECAPSTGSSDPVGPGPPSPQPVVDRRRLPQRDRRTDQRLARLADHAVALQRTQGDQVAAAFLSDHGVPGHVTLRVLACAAFRRKPGCRHPACARFPEQNFSRRGLTVKRKRALH